jgi:hypothetical protein
MVLLSFTVAGEKFQMEVVEEETVYTAKQRLEPICGMPAAQQRWLVKGKEAINEHKIGTLSASKLMVLRNHAAHAIKGAATAVKGAATSAAMLPVSGPGGTHAPAQDSASEAVLPSLSDATELGNGSLLLLVSNGRQLLRLHCDGSSTILSIKELLCASCGAAPRQQRLLAKGKEAADSSTIESLGLVGGSRLMLLFRETQHKLLEGDAMLRTCKTRIADLGKRIAEAESRGKRRLDEPMVVLTTVGALKDEVQAVRLDIMNSKTSSENERAIRLQEVDELGERLEMLREKVKGS